LSDENKQYVKKNLIRLNVPLYVESNSGLKGDPELEAITIKSGDKFVSLMMQKKYFDSVIRIGGVPTLRLWRDLEDKYKNIPVISISENEYTGLGRETIHFNNISYLGALELKLTKNENIFLQDKEIIKEKMDLINKFPHSEHSLIFYLSEMINNDRIYLGNSLPIRYWDEFSFKRNSNVFANRGANGIDGQISTFLGWSKTDEKNWCVIGDLTALYDLASLWITPQMTSNKNFIIIINNKGGQIFKKMFERDIFINSHDKSFNHWAQMWNWNYQMWNFIPSNEEFKLENNTVIEVIPDANETEQMNQHLEALWKKHML
jgi:2-succinyl-5-enolpyruvyl-6-hydroxy-3-cyclohexene-1-carboxylate synthase